MKSGRKIKKLFAVIVCMALLGGTAQAAEKDSVMNGYTQEDSVVLYIKDDGQSIDNVFIGNEAAKSFQTEAAGDIRTIVLLDNSLSIASEYRDDIKTFLTDLIAVRGDGDLITIATFSEEIRYLVRDCNDYLEAKGQVEALEFINQDTYFNKTLYEVLNDLEGDEIKYTRIIIIADGVENEKLGYTQEELHKKITEAKIPIYTLGCSTKGNEENLKQMFALSRLSNGNSYLMDDYSTDEILRSIRDDSKVLKLRIVPQENACDGSRQNVRVSFGEDFCQTDVVMPFIEKVEESQEAVTKAPETTAAQEPAPVEPEAEPQEQAKSFPVLLLIGVLAGIGILAGLIWMIRSKGKRDTKAAGYERKESFSMSTSSGEGTEILGVAPEKNPNSTEILVQKSSVKLILQDTKQVEKSFEYPLRDKVVIGKDKRKCQIVVDYDGSVSGVHCEISKRGTQYFVRDVGTNGIASTNGTYVDGQKATPELPLRSGSVLKLGRVSFKVNFR